MKRYGLLPAYLAALIAASALGGCASLGGGGGNGVSTEAQNKIADALADRIAHCGITGSLSIGVGFANTLGLNCPAQPYAGAPAVVAPLSNIAPALDVARGFEGGGGDFGGGGSQADFE